MRMQFCAALAAVENIAKTQQVDTGKYTYSYADLGDVIDEVKRVLEMHDLTFVQETGTEGERMTLTTTVLHPKTGQWVEFGALAIKMPNDAQGVGSALTYARRYSLLTIFAIAPEDDDGRAATLSATVQPGRRTEAERLIRESIAKMDAEQRTAFVEQFKFNFGVGLADLPANKHGEALTWAREWERQQLDPTIFNGDPDIATADSMTTE